MTGNEYVDEQHRYFIDGGTENVPGGGYKVKEGTCQITGKMCYSPQCNACNVPIGIMIKKYMSF